MLAQRMNTAGMKRHRRVSVRWPELHASPTQYSTGDVVAPTELLGDFFSCQPLAVRSDGPARLLAGYLSRPEVGFANAASVELGEKNLRLDSVSFIESAERVSGEVVSNPGVALFLAMVANGNVIPVGAHDQRGLPCLAIERYRRAFIKSPYESICLMVSNRNRQSASVWADASRPAVTTNSLFNEVSKLSDEDAGCGAQSQARDEALRRAIASAVDSAQHQTAVAIDNAPPEVTATHERIGSRGCEGLTWSDAESDKVTGQVRACQRQARVHQRRRALVRDFAHAPLASNRGVTRKKVSKFLEVRFIATLQSNGQSPQVLASFHQAPIRHEKASPIRRLSTADDVTKSPLIVGINRFFHPLSIAHTCC